MSSRKVLAIQARKRRPKGKKDKTGHHRRSPWPPDPVCVQIRGSLQSPGSSTYPDQMVDQHLERTSTALKDSGDQDN